MTTPVPLADLFTSENLFASLEVSLTGINLLRPVYEPDGSTITDFAIVYLNPAGQRMTGLAEQPGGTLLGHFPHALATGVFQYYQRVFETGEQLTYETNYQADGLDNFFRFSARRSGAHLVVSFTDTSDQNRSTLELALRESQAQAQAARAEAEQERAQLADLFQQVPAAICLLSGPALVYELVNPGYQQLFPQRNLVGQPLLDALPELQGSPTWDMLQQVYRTGQTQIDQGVRIALARTREGVLEDVYFDYVFQARANAQGQVQGVFVFAFDLTEQVRARQQVQVLNEELAALNEELRASNDEYQQANTDLSETQQQVQQLNQELEARVQVRARELVQAQAETEVQRQRLYQLVAQAPALIASLRGPEHVVELANEGFRAIFGGRELVGRTYRKAIPEFESQPFFDRLDRVYRTGETYHGIEEPVVLDRTNSGQLERTYITYTYQATRDAQGQIDGILVFCYEVTEQVRARQERELLLATVFESAPAAIWVAQGPDHVFELVSPLMAQFLGRTVAQMLHRPYFEVLPELADQGLPDFLRRVREQGETIYMAELPLHLAFHAPEQVGYYTFVLQPLPDARGQVTRVCCVGLDVTAQVVTRQQVEQLNQELVAINEELTATNGELHDSNTQLTRTNVDLDTFVYTASHDLKAPITNIESITLALRDTLPPAVQQDEMIAHLLDLLAHTTKRFQATIDQLTDLSKLQLAHAGPAEAVHLAATVESVRLDLVPVLTQANAHLTVEVAPDLLVSFSPANLRSAIYNLLSNAVKYRALDRPAQVRLRAFPAGARVVLEVQDNGLGMSAVQQRQLFGLFQRLHTHVEGTGVGLYITKRLVENGGGTIAVASQVDVGTTFTLTFPA